MRTMIRLLALVVVVWSGSTAGAQNGAVASQSKSWKWWLLSKNRTPPSSLLIHPNALEIGTRDRAREGAKQRVEERFFYGKFKLERLFFYRTERERALSARLAREAAKSPFKPPRKTASNTPPAPLEIGAGPATITAPVTPSFVGSPDQTPAPAPPTAVQVLDDLIDRTAQQLTSQPASLSARSTMFVVLIVAMFTVPAVAIVLLLLAISHLRARLWTRALIFAAMAAVVAWGAVATAQRIAPESPETLTSMLQFGQ
jgi:hypothetical protein